VLSNDVAYFKPKTISDAVELFQTLTSQGKHPMYYSGGTELLTLGRLNRVYTDAVIDLKGIQDCHLYEFRNDELIIGSTVGLYRFEKNVLFPLLTQTSKEVADYTARNKITIGGNICGQIFYREAVLPFLLSDSQIVVAGPAGIRKISINSAFNKQLHLEKGELLVQLITKKEYVRLPFLSIKKRNQWETGYPLITVASLKKDGYIRFAISGLCPYPFRSMTMEDILNEQSLSEQERVSKAVEYAPKPILDDIEGSKGYRIFVLKNILSHILSQLGSDGYDQILLK